MHSYIFVFSVLQSWLHYVVRTQEIWFILLNFLNPKIALVQVRFQVPFLTDLPHVYKDLKTIRMEMQNKDRMKN